MRLVKAGQVGNFGNGPTTRVPIDTVTFTVSAIKTDWMSWVTKTGEYVLAANNEHAGENLVVEMDIYNSRDFGFDESWTYLYYDNVSVSASSAE